MSASFDQESVLVCLKQSSISQGNRTTKPSCWCFPLPGPPHHLITHHLGAHSQGWPALRHTALGLLVTKQSLADRRAPWRNVASHTDSRGCRACPLRSPGGACQLFRCTLGAHSQPGARRSCCWATSLSSAAGAGQHPTGKGKVEVNSRCGFNTVLLWVLAHRVPCAHR